MLKNERFCRPDGKILRIFRNASRLIIFFLTVLILFTGCRKVTPDPADDEGDISSSDSTSSTSSISSSSTASSSSSSSSILSSASSISSLSSSTASSSVSSSTAGGGSFLVVSNATGSWNKVKIHNGSTAWSGSVDFSGASYLEFSVRQLGEPVDWNQIRIGLGDNTAAESPGVTVGTYVSSAADWTLVSIPVSFFSGVDLGSIVFIYLQDAGATGLTGIDEIKTSGGTVVDFFSDSHDGNALENGTSYFITLAASGGAGGGGFSSSSSSSSSGSLSTSSSTSSASSGSSGPYNVYFGYFHAHTSYSDGQDTPTDAFNWARYTGGMDFMGVADHCYGISAADWSNTVNEANAANVDGTFVAFAGFEWSRDNTSPHTYGNGHVTVVNTADYVQALDLSYDTFDELVNWLEGQSGGFAILNHPKLSPSEFCFGNDAGQFMGVKSDKVVGIELWNKNNWSSYYDTEGFFPGDDLNFMEEANAYGWKIGSGGGGDIHEDWDSANLEGMEKGWRMGVWATTKTRTAIIEAMQQRRFFSTLDPNLSVTFKLNDQIMGATVSPGVLDYEISAFDPDMETFNSIKLFKNGLLEQSWMNSTTTPSQSGSITAAAGDFFYVEVKQMDTHWAVSSPIWVE